MNIVTNSNKAKRGIELTSPAIFACKTVAEFVSYQGDQLCYNQIVNQLKVAFRAKIKAFLEAKNEDGTPKYTDKDIKAMKFDDWKPELRVTKTPQDKIDEILNVLPPEQRKAVLAKYEALKK